MAERTDATGTTLDLPYPPRRIVSLVPSYSELVAALRLADRLVGVTRYCIDPPELRAIRKIGGTKNPNLERIIKLEPELVLANREENCEEDVAALRDAGLPVYVGDVRSVSGLGEELDNVASLLASSAYPQRKQLDAAVDEQAHLDHARPRVRAACLIWRNPWMAASGDTYIGDLLRSAGAINVFEQHRDDRYPRVALKELIAADPEVVLLPDEPYKFGPRHRDELSALHGMAAARNGNVLLCDGQMLTWWGVRTAEALPAVAALLDQARPNWQEALAADDDLPPGLNITVAQQDVVAE